MKKYTPQVLPTFQVVSTVANQSLSPGDTQSVTVTVMPDATTTGYLEVWINSPQHKEVYKSPMASDHPQKFIAHTPVTTTFSYVLPGQLKSGSYIVSDLISSANQQTDYYLNENFDTFKVL